MNKSRNFEELLQQYLADELAPEEVALFLEFAQQEPQASLIRDELDQKLSRSIQQATTTAIEDAGANGAYLELQFEKVLTRAAFLQNNANVEPANTGRYRSFSTKTLWIRRVAAAAIIAIVLGAGLYFAFFQKKGGDSTIAKENTRADVAPPEHSRATITTALGQTVYLDSAANGKLLEQGGVALEKLADGQIAYNADGKNSSGDLVYHTLTNPRGSQVIDMTLSDGSRVWLNAGSSIRYPVGFVGKDRTVSMTGEAYFEITHDTTKPFYVSKGDVLVQVVGTHFNINAYDDEADIKVTLLEGAVKLKTGNATALLRPGQQGQLNNTLKIVNDIDLDDVMAWKNGLFQFNKADIETVMRQLSRWYDVEVVYEEKPTKLFKGTIPRDMHASNVLKVLAETGGVHFKIEGKKVIVKK